jgi:hypothetical protein
VINQRMQDAFSQGADDVRLGYTPPLFFSEEPTFTKVKKPKKAKAIKIGEIRHSPCEAPDAQEAELL